MKRPFYELMLVTKIGDQRFSDYKQFLKLCIEGGITSVQFREKKLPKQDKSHLAFELKQFLDKHRIPLIINDSIELAQRISAAGVHLGQTDGQINEARKILGGNALIGQSVNSLDEINCANHLQLDYIGIGAIFPTDNKPDVKTHWGLERLREAVSISKHPTVAIGGIDEINVVDIKRCGVSGIAAIGAFESDDPKKTSEILGRVYNPYQIS